MSTPKRLHIGMSLAPTWLSGDAWRRPDSNIEGIFGSDFAVDIARRSEAAHLDFVFRPDVSSLPLDVLETGSGFASLDPTVLLAAVARETSRIGLVSTVSTTFYPPYVVARQLQSLHWISNGRAGWNIVTALQGHENFGLDAMPDAEQRYARAAGAAQVIALEMSSARKAKALEVGASQVLDPSRCDALGEIRALTGGLGADVSFECIGNKHTAKLAIDAIRKAGKCVLVGIFEEPSEFNFFELVSTEKQLLGALAYNGEFADVIAFIADGRLDIAPLVTGRIGLEEIVERGFEELVNNKEHNVKIIVSPGG